MRRVLLLAFVLLAGCSGDSDEAAPTTASPTTERATTTNTLSPELMRAGFAASFETTRQDLAEEVEDQFFVEVTSVDKMAYEDDAVVVAVSSRYSSQDMRAGLAWEITQHLRTIWEVDALTEESAPNLMLSVDTARFDCPGSFMLRLADRSAAEADWRSACS